MHVEATERSSVRGAVEKAAAVGIGVFVENDAAGALSKIDVARGERGFEAVTQRSRGTHLVVERTVEAIGTEPMRKAAAFVPAFGNQAIEGAQGKNAAAVALLAIERLTT